MAGKQTKFNLDPLGLDDNLDIPNFDFSSLDTKQKKRGKSNDFARGALKGAKDTFTSATFIRSSIKKAIPEGYGQAWDMADQTAGSLRNLYNEAGTVAKPAIADARRAAKKLLPIGQKYLPKGASEIMRKFANGGEQANGNHSQESYRDSEITRITSDIFRFNTETEARSRAEDEVRDRIKDTIDQKRHKDLTTQLESIRISSLQTSMFNTKVASAYMRKSLELQYRQYYATVDMLEESRRFNTDTAMKLQVIADNSSIPDIVKMSTGDHLKRSLRNKFLDDVSGGIFGQRRDFIQQLTANVSKNILGRVKATVENVRGGLSEVGNVADEASMMGGLGDLGGPSGVNMAGQAAGGIGASILGNSKFVNKHLARARGFLNRNPRIAKVGNNLSYANANTQQILKQWAKTHTNQTGILGGLIDFGKENIRQTGNLDTSVSVDKRGMLGTPVSFTRRTAKTIEEIIPGLLSQIHREIKIMRTGDANTGLLTYDLDKNRFGDAGSVRKSSLGKLFDKSSQEYTKYQFDNIAKQIDPKGQLSAEQRAILGRTLLNDNVKGGLADKKRLSARSYFKGEAEPHAETFAGLFKQHFQGDETNEKRNRFSESFNALGVGVNDARAKIQEMINDGQLSILEDAGIVTDGKINMEVVMSHFGGKAISAADVEGLPEVIASGTGGFKRVRQRGAKRRPVTPEATGFSPTRNYNKTTNNYTNDASSIVGAIEKFNNRDIHEVIRDTLLRVEDRIAAGIPIAGSGMGEVPKKKGRWWNMSIGQAAGNLGGLAGKLTSKAFGAVRNAGNEIAGRAAKLGGLGFNIGAGVLKHIGTGIGISTNKLRGFADVYVKGSTIPVLTVAGFKAGLYRNAKTNKVIKSYKEIQDGVIDADGKELLGVNDVQNAYVKTPLGERLITLAGSAIGGLTAGLNSIRNHLPGIYNMGFNALKAVGKAAWGQLDGPVDVYVKGRPDAVLSAYGMRTGIYFSAKTGKPIKKFSDIDGAVIDSDDKTLLTTDDITKGLVDKNGKPITHGLTKLAGILGSVAGLGFKLLRKGTRAVGNFVNGIGAGLGSVAGGVGDFFKNLVGPEGLIFAGGKKMIDRLTEIRDILDNRLPGKKVFGDSNGDGVRDNSYEDMKRKEKDATDKTTSGVGKGTGVGGIFGGLWDKLRGKKKEEPEKDKDGNDIDINIPGGEKVPKGKLPKEKVPKGAWNKTKFLARKGGSLLKKGAGIAMDVAGLGGLSSLSSGLGTAGKFVARSALNLARVGIPMLIDGAAVAGSTALGIGSSILGGIGAILSAPVLLGIAAVAAVGVAGYYGYKYLTRKTLTTLSKVRYAQYGFLTDDEKHFTAVFTLEDKLLKHLTWTSGVPNIDASKIKAKDVVEDFGIDASKDEQVKPWLTWFVSRFKPVFLTHLAALHAIDPKIDLGDVESLKTDQKKKYLNDASFTEGPYSVSISPFTDLKSLSADSTVVQTAIQNAKNELDKLPATTSAADKATVATAAVAATGAVAGVTGPATKTGGNDKTPSAIAGIAGPVTAGTAAGAVAGLTAGSNRYSGVATVDPNSVTGFSLGRIEASTVIRYKTYGLIDMQIEKVKALDNLESVIGPMVSYDKNGSALWNGSIDALVSAVGPSFGIEGSTNNRAYDWVAWFKLRFLPTFLNWATALRKKTNKLNPIEANAACRPQDQLDVATAVYTTKTVYAGSTTSVWNVPSTPWPGYALNDDVSSTDKNIQGLRDIAKRLVAPEEGKTGSGTSKDAADKAADAKALGAAGATPEKNQGFWSRLFGDNDKDKGITPVVGGKSGNWFSNMFSGNSAADVRSGRTGAAAANANMSGGKEINQPGKGTGGDINAVPKPSGNKSFQALKETINGAAKMAGADPHLMSVMAAIESGFDYTVKAGTSNALGLYQFIPSTWAMMIKKYGPKYGIDPNTPATDPRANALMGAEYINENAAALKGVLNRPLTDTDLYLAHFMGAGGAKQFLKADPNTVGSQLFPQQARSNPTIFNKGGQPLTLGQIYQNFNALVQSKGKQFGLGTSNDGSEAITSAAAPAATAAATTTASTAATPATTPSTASNPSVAATPVPSAPTSPPRDTGTQAMASGFNVPSMTAQATYQKETANPVTTNVDAGINRQLLEVNQKQLDALVTLVDYFSNGGKVPSGGSSSSTSTTESHANAVTNATSGAPTPVPKAPISMSKNRS